MITDVSLQYARALFELASSDEKKEFYENLMVIKKTINDNQEVLKVFEHPLLTPDQKKEIIKNTLINKVSDTFLNFMYVIIDHHRINELGNITDSYKLILDDYLQQKEVLVYSSYPLTKLQILNLNSSLSKHYNKQIKIVEKIDSSLVGGIKIVVDNEIIDATILNKLEKVIDSIKM